MKIRSGFVSNSSSSSFLLVESDPVTKEYIKALNLVLCTSSGEVSFNKFDTVEELLDWYGVGSDYEPYDYYDNVVRSKLLALVEQVGIENICILQVEFGIPLKEVPCVQLDDAS